MRSAFRGSAHQLAVRMRINNCTHAIIIIMAQATSHAPYASNCACAEGLYFSAFQIITIVGARINSLFMSMPVAMDLSFKLTRAAKSIQFVAV